METTQTAAPAKRHPKHGQPLTPRETQIAKLLAEGNRVKGLVEMPTREGVAAPAPAPIVPAFLLEAQRAAPAQIALKAEVDAWLAAERGGR